MTSSVILPTQPSSVHNSSLKRSIDRRFSMPSIKRSDLYFLGNLKRSSSHFGKDPPIRHTDPLPSSNILDNGTLSLRLVQNTGLPLSLNIQTEERHSNCNRLSNRLLPTCPSFPVLRSKSVDYPRTHLKSKRRISLPFPLTPGHVFSVPPTSIPLDDSNTLAHLDVTAGKRLEHPPTTLRPLPPVLLSVNFSSVSVPSPLPSPSQLYHSELSSVSKEKSIASPKATAPRKSSLRPRRSPVLGPSPLRAMILPDPSDSNISVQASSSQTDANARRDAGFEYSHFGLTFPQSPSKGHGADIEKGRDAAPLTAVDNDGDTNTLLGMIRELVEETDRWDGSLFKDENFRAMMDDSKEFLSNKHHGKSFATENSSCPRSLTTCEDKSCEVDLNLLGLDIFRAGGETYILDDTNPFLGTETRLATLWEDSGTDWEGDDSKAKQ
ncbi:hypothetical protein H0H93_007195 [Arthromyces matolae]|nr:hypothetical protein H0H93_007195 [Arthromyces matolae]